MSTLFEYLGIAAQERIHSQTLAWLLTPNVSPLKPAHRVALLQALGLECEELDVSVLRVQTELDSLDLVCASNTKLLVIENKLKSRQASDQLLGYDAKIAAVSALLGTSASAHKVFLTLSREKSGCGWLDVDYAQLILPLTDAAAVVKNGYVSDYVEILSKLVAARTAFLDNPGAFQEVHKRVSWSAAKRLQEPLPDGISNDEVFISSNRLERIFVETLLRDLVADIPNAIADAGAHGNPLVQVPLWLVEICNGGWYRAGLQLQGKKLKLNIADIDYEGSRPGTSLPMFDDDLEVAGGVERKAHKGTSRDYRSWVWDAPQPLSSIAPPPVGFVRTFKDEVNSAETAWQQALEVLQRQAKIKTFETWTPARASELLIAVRASRKKLKKESQSAN